VWLTAHIYFLINFRNRLVVMFDLAAAYWTFQRYARIVISPIRRAPGLEAPGRSPSTPSTRPGPDI
jgi:NADH dehydrogenase